MPGVSSSGYFPFQFLFAAYADQPEGAASRIAEESEYSSTVNVFHTEERQALKTKDTAWFKGEGLHFKFDKDNVFLIYR